jgi:peroxiredoxin
MRAWVSRSLAGTERRGQLVRTILAVALVAGLVWALPVRRAGQDGGHHAAHMPELDAFERAGVTELREGHGTPPLRLPRLDGGVTSLGDHREQLVVVNFWATWCEPCTTEMPTLEALWREYRERGLIVLGVSVDRGAPRAVLDPYVGRLGLTFPVLLDADLKASQGWRVNGLPATFVIRPGGQAVGMAFGAREWNSAEMRRLLETLLPHAH